MSATKQRRPWITMAVLCAIGAAAVIRRLVAMGSTPVKLPQMAALDAHFEAKAGLILFHILPSLLFVLLAPLQFITTLRVRYPRFHRWNGRVAMVGGVLAAGSALRLSMHPVGGLLEGSATTLFGCFFLFSLGKAWWHIRSGRMEKHREWATRMTAIALGVATTRPVMGVFFATSRLTGLTPHEFFGMAMWIGFVSTWLAGEAWIRQARRLVAARRFDAVALSA